MKRFWIGWLAVSAWAIPCLSAYGQEEESVQTQAYVAARLPFVDEAKRDAEFLDFRIQLVAALKLKDLTWLLDGVDVDIECGGNRRGIAAFRRIWKLDAEPDKSTLWEKMLKAVTMGGVFHRDTFTAPYIYAKFPRDYDHSSFGVITGNGVNVREHARSNSRAIDKLSYSIVKMANDGEAKVMEIIGKDSHFWERIILPSGQTAYVYGKYLYRPNDYHATFQPFGAKWKLTAFFIEGDTSHALKDVDFIE